MYIQNLLFRVSRFLPHTGFQHLNIARFETQGLSTGALEFFRPTGAATLRASITRHVMRELPTELSVSMSLYKSQTLFSYETIELEEQYFDYKKVKKRPSHATERQKV